MMTDAQAYASIANSQAATEIGRGIGDALPIAAKGLFGDDTGVMGAIGAIDSRGFLDGSQWTVSTGGGSATGGERTAANPFASSITSKAPLSMPPAMQAGFGGNTLGLVIFGLIALMAIKKFGG